MNARTAFAISAAALVAMSAPCRSDEQLPSLAEQVVRIDAGRRLWKEIDKTRVSALLEQMATRYGTTQQHAADVAVKASQILRDKYGIEETIQSVLENVNRVHLATPTANDLPLVAAVYVQLRNAGSSGEEASAAISAELAKRPEK